MPGEPLRIFVSRVAWDAWEPRIRKNEDDAPPVFLPRFLVDLLARVEAAVPLLGKWGATAVGRELEERVCVGAWFARAHPFHWHTEEPLAVTEDDDLPMVIEFAVIRIDRPYPDDILVRVVESDAHVASSEHGLDHLVCRWMCDRRAPHSWPQEVRERDRCRGLRRLPRGHAEQSPNET